MTPPPLPSLGATGLQLSALIADNSSRSPTLPLANAASAEAPSKLGSNRKYDDATFRVYADRSVHSTNRFRTSLRACAAFRATRFASREPRLADSAAPSARLGFSTDFRLARTRVPTTTEDEKWSRRSPAAIVKAGRRESATAASAVRFVVRISSPHRARARARSRTRSPTRCRVSRVYRTMVDPVKLLGCRIRRHSVFRGSPNSPLVAAFDYPELCNRTHSYLVCDRTRRRPSIDFTRIYRYCRLPTRVFSPLGLRDRRVENFSIRWPFFVLPSPFFSIR